VPIRVGTQCLQHFYKNDTFWNVSLLLNKCLYFSLFKNDKLANNILFCNIRINPRPAYSYRIRLILATSSDQVRIVLSWSALFSLFSQYNFLLQFSNKNDGWFWSDWKMDTPCKISSLIRINILACRHKQAMVISI
jgi:hypothetical protein